MATSPIPVSATARGRTVTYKNSDGSTFSKSGTHPNRDSNPLDLRSGGFATRHGAIGKDKGFGIFPTADVGIQAAVANMDRINNAKPFFGKATLQDLIETWSPKTENNTAKMVRDIPVAAGLSAKDNWSSLTQPKKEQFIEAYAEAEGYIPQ